MSLDKPRTPTQEDVDSKAPINNPTFTGTIAIPNYADLETTLDTIEINRAPLTSPTFTGQVTTGDLEVTTLKFIRTNLTGITASTSQSQGNGALTNTFNEVTTVANDNDVVTIPTAVKGIECFIENKGANILQIFPASGDDLGNGLNASVTLETNGFVKFFTYDTTTWTTESLSERFHGEFHDEDNTDAFVINTQDELHAYHSNGIVFGDLVGWTFDAGGNGVSFPIASILDAGSGDIEVTTTGSHGLAIGDIISQTGLSDAAYVGIFVVKVTDTATTYEVTAVFTATGTGTMDQAATLTCQAIAAGQYAVDYSLSATPATNNSQFDFELFHDDEKIIGTKRTRKFGTGGDFGVVAGLGIHDFDSGSKIALILENQDNSGNITVEDVSIRLIRL